MDLPTISARGLPGNRTDAWRAGMTIRTLLDWGLTADLSNPVATTESYHGAACRLSFAQIASSSTCFDIIEWYNSRKFLSHCPELLENRCRGEGPHGTPRAASGGISGLRESLRPVAVLHHTSPISFRFRTKPGCRSDSYR